MLQFLIGKKLYCTINKMREKDDLRYQSLILRLIDEKINPGTPDPKRYNSDL